MELSKDEEQREKQVSEIINDDNEPADVLALYQHWAEYYDKVSIIQGCIGQWVVFRFKYT